MKIEYLVGKKYSEFEPNQQTYFPFTVVLLTCIVAMIRLQPSQLMLEVSLMIWCSISY